MPEHVWTYLLSADNNYILKNTNIKRQVYISITKIKKCIYIKNKLYIYRTACKPTLQVSTSTGNQAP